MKYKKGHNPNSIKALRPIKKGEVRNPEGGRAHGALRQRITREYFNEVIEMALNGNLDDLEAVVKDPTSTALKVGVAKALHRAMANGDWGTLQSICERLVGKVPVNIDHTSAGEKLAPQVVITLPSNGREVK